jgi:hypothetical protein
MAKTKTSTASKKQPASTPAEQSAPRNEEATAPAASVSAKSDVSPDVAVGALLLHSERLAKTVASHADELTAAKITPKHQGELTHRIATLRTAEAVWQKARGAAAPGAVAKGRDRPRSSSYQAAIDSLMTLL